MFAYYREFSTEKLIFTSHLLNHMLSISLGDNKDLNAFYQLSITVKITKIPLKDDINFLVANKYVPLRIY